MSLIRIDQLDLSFNVDGQPSSAQRSENVAPSFPKPSVRRNSYWSLFGNLFYAVCQWGMLILLAKLGSPQEVGLFVLGFSVCAPLIMFVSCQLRTVQGTDAGANYSFSDYLGFRLISLGIVIVLITIIAFSAGYHDEEVYVILLVALAKAVESVGEVFYGFFQLHEKLENVAKSLIIKGTFSLTLLGTCFYLTQNLLWGLFGLLVAWGIPVFCYDLKKLRFLLIKAEREKRTKDGLGKHPHRIEDLRPNWSLKTFVSLGRLVLPLGAASAMYSLRVNMPRYFVASVLGEKNLGIFAALSYLSVVGGRIAHSLGQAVSPRLAKFYCDGADREFRSLLLKILGLSAFLGVVAIVSTLFFGETFLLFCYGTEYAANAQLFLLLMIAAGVEYLIIPLQYALTAARYLRVQTATAVLSLLVLIFGCFVFIPKLGLIGAATAQLVAVLTEIVVSLSVTLLLLTSLKKIAKTVV